MITTPFGNYIDIEKGVRIMTSSWRRNADEALPARGKIVGGYVNMAFQKSEAELNGFDEALVLRPTATPPRRSAANLFVVRDGVAPDAAGLRRHPRGRHAQGDRRSWRQDAGIPVEVRSIDRSELYVCDEMFLCGTGVQVSAGRSRSTIARSATGAIGPIARLISERYFDAVRGNLPEYRSWLTPIG